MDMDRHAHAQGWLGHRGVTATRSYGSQRIFDSRYILRVNNVYNCNIATENEFQVQLEHVQLQVVLLARTSRSSVRLRRLRARH